MDSTILNKKVHPRLALVEVMILSLNYWELTTNYTKFDLAKKTKIWQTQIDGGKVRARTLDKYLSLEKLPKYPRWVNVIKTANFVLKVPPSNSFNSSARKRLELSLSNLETLLSKSAVV